MNSVEKRFELLMCDPKKNLSSILDLCKNAYINEIPDITFFFKFIENVNMEEVSRKQFLEILKILEEMDHKIAYNATFEAIASHHSLVNMVIDDLLATLLKVNANHIKYLINALHNYSSRHSYDKTLPRSVDEHFDRFLFTLFKIDYYQRNPIFITLFNALTLNEDYIHLLGIFLDNIDRLNYYFTIIQFNETSRVLNNTIRWNYSKHETKTLGIIMYSMITNKIPSIIDKLISAWKDLPRFIRQKDHTTWREKNVPHPSSSTYNKIFSEFLKVIGELNMLKEHYLYILKKIIDLPFYHRTQALHFLNYHIPRREFIENYIDYLNLIESFETSEDKIKALFNVEKIVQRKYGYSSPEVIDLKTKIEESFVRILKEEIGKAVRPKTDYYLWNEFISLSSLIEDSQLVNRIIIEKKLTHILNFFLHIDENNSLLNMFKERKEEIQKRFPLISDYSFLN